VLELAIIVPLDTMAQDATGYGMTCERRNRPSDHERGEPQYGDTAISSDSSRKYY